jgi:iron complex transport system substrate-binding protein
VTALLRALALIALLLPGSAWALTVVDQTGRTLTLPAPPRRIVSLVPSVT